MEGESFTTCSRSSSQDAAAPKTVFLHLAGPLRKERKGVMRYPERRRFWPLNLWVSHVWPPPTEFGLWQSREQRWVPRATAPSLPSSARRRKTSRQIEGRRRPRGAGLLPAARRTARGAGSSGAERAAPPRGRHRPAPAPPPRRRPSASYFYRRSGKAVTSVSGRRRRTRGGPAGGRLQAVGIAMAPVLSKDVADIEVPTARGLARGGRGAPPVGPRKAAAATAGPGKEWHSRKLCLRGRFSGSGGDAEGRGAGARPGPPGEKWAAPRLEGCPLGWDLAVYFGAGLKKSLKGSDGRTTRVGKKWTFHRSAYFSTRLPPHPPLLQTL